MGLRGRKWEREKSRPRKRKKERQEKFEQGKAKDVKGIQDNNKTTLLSGKQEIRIKGWKGKWRRYIFILFM